MPNTQSEKAKYEQSSSDMADDGGADDNGDRSSPTGAMLKEMSKAILKTIKDWFDQFETKFISLQSSHNILAARMDSMEEMASHHESHLMVMEKAIHELQVENTCLRAKTDDHTSK